MIRLRDLQHGLSDADARTMVDWINAELERDAAIGDTHPKGGDTAKTGAPFMSGAGSRSEIAQTTPVPPPLPSKESS